MTRKEIEKALRELYPHGHPKFIEVTLDEIELHNKKNYDYAHGGNPLGNFYRVADALDPYYGVPPEVIALMYGQKQRDAALWMISQSYEGEIEGVVKRLQDDSIYTKLALIIYQEEHL